MAAYLDVCRFVPTAGGTTDWTFSAAVTGYQSPNAAGVVHGTVYRYRAESSDLSQWEIGYGAYNTGSNVLARTTVLSNNLGTGTAAGQSGAGTKINFSSVPQVAIVALAEDLPSLTAANAFTDTTASTTTATGAMTIAGGLGVAGQVSANNFAAFGTVSATPTLNALSSSVSVAAAGNQTFATTSTNLAFFIIRENSTTGDWVVGIATSGGVVILNQSAGASYSVTTTPAAGKYGVAYDGTANYKIYNGAAAAKSFTCATIAV